GYLGASEIMTGQLNVVGWLFGHVSRPGAGGQAMVARQPRPVHEDFRIGQQHAAFARGDVFITKKGETRREPEGAQGNTGGSESAGRMRTVFNQRHAVLIA